MGFIPFSNMHIMCSDQVSPHNSSTFPLTLSSFFYSLISLFFHVIHQPLNSTYERKHTAVVIVGGPCVNLTIGTSVHFPANDPILW